MKKCKSWKDVYTEHKHIYRQVREAGLLQEMSKLMGARPWKPRTREGILQELKECTSVPLWRAENASSFEKARTQKWLPALFVEAGFTKLKGKWVRNDA